MNQKILQERKVSGPDPFSKDFPVFTPNKILGFGRELFVGSRMNFPNSPISYESFRISLS